MDVLAVPSRFETFGLVMAEGMDAGCQVVASRIDGLRHILEHQPAGILFRPDDAADLSRALTEAWARRGHGLLMI